MKKAIAILSFTALSAILAGSILISANHTVKEAKAEAVDYQTYVPLRDGWIENTDGSAESNLNDLIRARNDRFWNGQASGWDSQERSFNALDEFVDTIHRANGGEGWRGAYRTPELVLKDNDHRYVSFLFGGGGNDIFVNIFQVSGAAGSGDRISGIRTALDESGYFENEGGVNPDKLNAPISCNMVLKYYELPNEIQPGDHFLIYVRDGRTGGYGGFTFGDVHINQTLEDVARTFSAHKAQMKLNEFASDWTRVANEYVLNYYANDSYYAAVRTAEAALTDANDDFEINNRLSKWAYDQQNSTFENGALGAINYDGIYATADTKLGGYFNDNDGYMPLNKSGNQYLTGEPSDIGDGIRNCGLPESAKYRLVSPEFTLTGTGLVSAKLGGHYTKMSLLDSNFNVLLTTGDENPAFVDSGVANIINSGSRLCTMVRTYLDCSAYLNQRVHIALEDGRTGGGWNLSFFDEVVTNYPTLPSFKLDVISQHSTKSEEVYNGVVFDKLVVGANYNADFKAAYDFVNSYYGAARNSASGFSRCSADLSGLMTTYDGLSSAAKAVVDESEDYYYGDNMGHFDGDWYFASVNKTYKIGQAITAIKTGEYPVQNVIMFSNMLSVQSNTLPILFVVVFVSAAFVALSFIFIQRKRKHADK